MENNSELKIEKQRSTESIEIFFATKKERIKGAQRA